MNQLKDVERNRKHAWLNILWLTGCAAFVLISRILTTSTYAFGKDGANYMLAIQDFSIANIRPHYPGYPVYVALIKVTAFITGSGRAGIAMAVILFSIGSVLATYWLTRMWVSERAARWAAVLLASNPTFWFYGSVAENYAVDACFGVGLILAVTKLHKWPFIIGIGVGLALGTRGTSFVLLLPVVLYMIYHYIQREEITRWDVMRAILGMLIGIAVWLPYVIINEGGLKSYLQLSTRLYKPETLIGNVAGFILGIGWMLNVGIILMAAVLIGRLRMREFRISEISRFEIVALALWIAIPAIFFFFIIFAKGYGLLILPGFYILMATLLDSRLHTKQSSYWLTRLSLAGMVFANLIIFFVVPYAPWSSSLKRQDRTFADRIRTNEQRAISDYAPTLSKLIASDAQISSALGVVARVAEHDSAVIALDPASVMYLTGRILQLYAPERHFAELAGSDSVMFLYHGIDYQELEHTRTYFSNRPVFLLTPIAFAPEYCQALECTITAQNNYFALLEPQPDKRAEICATIGKLLMK